MNFTAAISTLPSLRSQIGLKQERWRRWATLTHLWVGAAAAVYLLFVCLTGSAILFEPELYRVFSPDPAVEPTGKPRLSEAELRQILTARYPEHRILGIWDRKVSAETITELWLDGPDGMRMRLLHPNTAADLGDARPLGLRVLAALRRAHISLLAGPAGRVANGVGSLFLVILALSGTVVWRFRRNSKKATAAFHERTSGRAERLHRRAGVWILVFAGMWGLTGALFALPSLSHAVNGWFEGETLPETLYALHTGAIGGWPIKMIWAACGLLTSLLVIAGVLAWWQKAAQVRLSQQPG